MLSKFLNKVLTVKNAAFPMIASLMFQARACDGLLGNNTAMEGVKETFNQIAPAVFGLAVILFVWGPVKLKDAAKITVVGTPIAAFVVNYSETIVQFGQGIADWFTV